MEARDAKGETMSAEGTKMPEPIRAFAEYANDKGYDIAYTYDTERSRWVFLNPMTADLWRFWLASREEAMEEAAKACEAIRDDAKEVEAKAKFDRAMDEGPERDAVARGEFWLTVSTFNAGLKRAASAIRALADVDAKEVGK